MKKRPLIIIMVLILIALTIAIAYFGYNIYEYNNQKAKVENYIISGELDKAKETLKKAMKFNKFSGLDDNRTLSAIENFKISIDKFEQKDYEEADKYMKKIDETKLKDKKLMADIISFKSKLKDKLATESQYNATITEIESLIEKNEYKEANNKFSALSNLKLDDEQNKYVSKLKIKVTEEINRLKKEEEEQKEREKKEREEAILAENKKKEEEARKVLEEEERKREEERKKKEGYSREEAKKIFLDKSKFDENIYKVVISENEDINFNGDICYLIKVSNLYEASDIKEYYINSRTGDFTKAENLR